jgi:hypothetical protein
LRFIYRLIKNEAPIAKGENVALSRLSLITGIALALLSCVQPVDLKGFVDGLPKPAAEVDIEYRKGEEGPNLYSSIDTGGGSWRALPAGGDPVNPSLNVYLTGTPINPNEVTIQVMDWRHFDSILWYCESNTELTTEQGVTGEYDEKLVITAGKDPFVGPKTYHMTVVGKKDERRYGTSVFIKVVQ